MKGTLKKIFVRPKKRAETKQLQVAHIDRINGIVGDHYDKGLGKRQVTLISVRYLDLLRAALNVDPIHPGLTRRNLLMSDLDFDVLIDQKSRIKIGKSVVLEITGPCKPCGQMERLIGKGAQKAMHHLGGATARVIHAGPIHQGDQVIVL